ncbi:hypothetical protein QQF64_029269 [Cirrhinus molitorella]|uniref:AIG1-type G domain-containing protein n=1 Tax=Cirrhinus molitorella TaxID=172907 RepID=A0ABR3N8Y1_9TELE
METPGWNLMKQTPESIKKSVERSVVLCPPGPHALLLVIRVKRDEKPIAGAIKAAEKHMELLSEHVWKHTIILFACDDGVGDFNIQGYFQKTKKILEKCKGRTYILESHSKISELFTKIDDLVEENCGDVFIPQTNYALFEGKTQDVRRRRRSLPKNPPEMADKVMILMAVSGALVSAVAGVNSGVSGAGLLGYILGVSLHFLLFVFFKKNMPLLYAFIAKG